MEHPDNYLETLIAKNFRQEATAAEEAELLQLICEDKSGRITAMIGAYLGTHATPVADDPQLDEAYWYRLADNVLMTDRISQVPPVSKAQVLQAKTPVRKIPTWQWAAAAAVLLAIGLYVLYPRQQASNLQAIEVQPGYEGAVLTLADGSQVQLDTLQNGVIALQEGVTARISNGVLHYEGTAGNTVYNTMTTPKGRQFQLTLPDGSKVWLNAASSIHYPIAFTGNERKVKIKGEAYFEIKADAHRPFRVDVNGKQTVEVLGTAFNINSYEDENAISTTLLEGSIRVRTNIATILKPGQQTVQERGTQTLQTLHHVDTDQVIAWKNGAFNFTDMDAATIFRQLSRWYDITVKFEGKPPTEKFWGKMSRKLPLSEVLELLKGLNLQFRLEGKTLIVNDDQPAQHE